MKFQFVGYAIYHHSEVLVDATGAHFQLLRDGQFDFEREARAIFCGSGH